MKIIRLDIETTPLLSEEQFDECRLGEIREERYCKDKPQDVTPRERYRVRSSLFGEFGKVVCVSMIVESGEIRKEKTIINDDEKILLTELSETIKNRDGAYGGHNVKNYDLPFLVKRMLYHGIPPYSLYQGEKKPREMNVVDTMEVFKCGGYSSSSLDVMCEHLGVISPKDIMTGDEVKEIRGDRHQGKEKRQALVQKVSEYCMADVRASMECYHKINKLLCPTKQTEGTSTQ